VKRGNAEVAAKQRTEVLRTAKRRERLGAVEQKSRRCNDEAVRNDRRHLSGLPRNDGFGANALLFAPYLSRNDGIFQML